MSNPPPGPSLIDHLEVARHGKRNMTSPESRASNLNVPEALLRLRSVETELRAIGRGDWPLPDVFLVADLIRSTRIQFMGDTEL